MKRKVSKNRPIPLYLQLKDIIRTQIEEGLLKPDSPLPSERELCRLHSISHITVRQALVDLTRDGVLFRVPGKGTFIRERDAAVAEQRMPVGAVIAETREKGTSPFVAELIQGFKASFNRSKYPMLLYFETETNYLTDAEHNRVQGLIISAPEIGDIRVRMLMERKTPFVVIGRATEEHVKTVDNNNVRIGHELAAHLLDRGRRKIGFINGPAAFTVSQDRATGYRQALREHKIVPDETLIKYGEFAEAHGYEHGPELVRMGVTAIMCGDDLIAFGVLRALKEAGIPVPEQIMVAGCNNALFTAHTSPSLTTMDIFPYRIGQEAADKLIRTIEGGEPEERTLVEAQLIVRESTGGGAP